MEYGCKYDLTNFVYPGLHAQNATPPPKYFLNHIILAAQNWDVDSVNSDVLKRMSSMERIYYSADTIVFEPGADPNKNEDPFPVEFLHTLRASGLPLGKLHPKPGCPLILLQNVSPSQGLCNGTQLILWWMSDRVLECTILSGDHDGDHVFIPCISLTPSGNITDFLFTMSCQQFPVNLAFAISINKSQGQSVKHVGVHLSTAVFSHGQLYVALSQVTSAENIKLLLAEDSVVAETTNIVYPEVLVD